MPVDHRRVSVSILLLHGILIKRIHIKQKIKNNYEIQEVLILRSTALSAVSRSNTFVLSSPQSYL